MNKTLTFLEDINFLYFSQQIFLHDFLYGTHPIAKNKTQVYAMTKNRISSRTDHITNLYISYII